MISADSKLGAAGPQSGSIVAIDTLANIVGGYNATTYDGCEAIATDLGKSGVKVKAYGGQWVLEGGKYTQIYNNNTLLGYININPSGATYSQSGTAVTITWTSHGLTAALHNGHSIYLAPSSGSAAAGWYTNVQVIDANTIQCTSSASLSTSGNLGGNASETFAPDFMTVNDNLIRTGTVTAPTFLNFAKNNANSKTFKMYIGGIQITSTAMTTGISTSLSGTAWWCSATEFFIQGSAARNAAANKKWQGSLTLSSSNDWMMLIPTYFNLMGG